ncbi:hypothetical protein [Roseomonas sp. AR75]|jgi:hypothetical protein|uniref:hypothetical protein n=1 Tax=Roseomonas sp. AR75 TaxID=2562311 RepID=UPI0010C0F2A3|nr:hypothetical protein [Roseomonas sp. AR75]
MKKHSAADRPGLEDVNLIRAKGGEGGTLTGTPEVDYFVFRGRPGAGDFVIEGFEPGRDKLVIQTDFAGFLILDDFENGDADLVITYEAQAGPRAERFSTIFFENNFPESSDVILI